MPTQLEQAQRLYDRLAPVYGPVAGWWERPARKAGLAALAAQQREQVLEIGCGTGRALVHLAQAVGTDGRVVGVDVSPRMCAVARGTVARVRRVAPVEVVQGDAARLPFSDANFDACLLSFTLELFDPSDRRAVLAECRRTLRPGGRVVVVGLSDSGPDTPMRRAYRRAHRRFPTVLDCRPIGIANAVVEAGFLPVATSLTRLWGLPVQVVSARNP